MDDEFVTEEEELLPNITSEEDFEGEKINHQNNNDNHDERRWGKIYNPYRQNRGVQEGRGTPQERTLEERKQIAQYDNEYLMPEQINDHELIHDRYKSPLVQKVKNIILNNLSKNKKNDVLEKLSRDYNGIIEGNEEAIFEEFVANVLSEMDYDYLARFRDLEKAFWKGDEEFIDSYDAATYAESSDSGGTYEQVEYTEKQLRDFGWAYSNGLMNEGEYKDFWSKFADAINGRATFAKSQNGEHIIPVSDTNDESVYGINNTLVFAKGTITDPVITSVLKLKTNNETDGTLIRRFIYECEREGIRTEAEELFARYYPNDSGFSRQTTSASLVHSERGKNGRRSNKIDTGIENGKNIKYSLDDDGNVIPLSKRFNTKNKDIRYSMEEGESEHGQEEGRHLLSGRSGRVDVQDSRKQGGGIFDKAGTLTERTRQDREIAAKKLHDKLLIKQTVAGDNVVDVISKKVYTDDMKEIVA